MDLSNIGTILLDMILPAIWVSIGPVVTTAITATVNAVIKTYVPRSLQLILAPIIGAVFAGITGDVAGVDPNMAAAIGGASGIGVQSALMLDPKRFLASKKDV